MTATPTDAAPGSAAPRCPEHDVPLRLRTARRGRNAGNQFWGCPRYPECTYTLNAGPGTAAAASQPTALRRRREPQVPTDRLADKLPIPVQWFDATLRREGWICRYASAGASLRSIPGSERLLRPLATCWIARPEGAPSSSDPRVRRFVTSVQKVIQRGLCPPVHPAAERRLLETAELGDRLLEPPTGELRVRLSMPPALDPSALRSLWNVETPTPDSYLPFDSEEERLFLCEWAPENLPPEIVRTIVPQAPLDALARAARVPTAGDRRVDFLLQTGAGQPLVVEIDGDQHREALEVDRERDELLRRLGVPVIRVPAAEMRGGEGPVLDEIRKKCERPESSTQPSRAEALLTTAPAALHRAVIALTEALRAGLLHGDDWSITIEDPLGVVAELLPPYLDVMAAIDTLWGTGCMPSRVTLHADAVSTVYRRVGVRYEPVADEDAPGEQLAILLESELGPNDELGPPPAGVPTIVVRSALLPVRVADPLMEGSQRAYLAAEPEDAADALTVLLQALFAKRGFRHGQVDAVLEVLEGRSCAVLLPTGGGKSLIYQLAGLLLPGRTIVVDPIIALMEDQVAGLQAQGIDRVTAISSYSARGDAREELLASVAAGDALFVFIAPERLQQRGFRNALRELSQNAPINLAVVDEAHCVSEWGHQFRTAYLNLGRILRQQCAAGPDDAGPPILALTGTASRAVLRDDLIELGIERDSDRAVVRPTTFDRKELRYEIIRGQPSDALAALRGVIRGLPAKYGLPPTTFFQPHGERTMSGIVFCSTVNGEMGVVSVTEALRDVTQGPVTMYSGGAPKGLERSSWEFEKRRNAEDFKANRAPVLVSTKAFGMGIDKPNVRFVVHYGLPDSIEGYYQEVGRAGRDRERAECVLVAVDYDDARARRLLDEQTDLERARDEHDRVRRAESDDVTRQLWFHFGAFRGREAEIAATDVLLTEIGNDVGRAASIRIPMGERDDDERERAIHRLVILGVVDDYLVSWGSREYELELAPCSASRVLEHLIRYVRRSQPGRADAIRDELRGVEQMPLDDAIRQCSRALIAFVYDTVERSRRRSLREMWLAAHEAGHDDEAFRRRILDYLAQGDIAPVLERLVDEPQVRMLDWCEQLDSVAPGPDGHELRGNTARLLSSYPDHPGLLLARGVSEMLIADGDLDEVVASLAAAFRSSDRYRVADADRAAVIEWLVGRARREPGSGVLTAVSAALERAGDVETPTLDRLSTEAPEAGVGVLSLNRALAEISTDMKALSDLYDDVDRGNHEGAER
jgi:ATP-dependent DNA helicase RecQ